MSRLAPDYMLTKEWEDWYDGKGGLKPDTPEWFVKVVEGEERKRQQQYEEAAAGHSPVIERT